MRDDYPLLLKYQPLRSDIGQDIMHVSQTCFMCLLTLLKCEGFRKGELKLNFMKEVGVGVSSDEKTFTSCLAFHRFHRKKNAIATLLEVVQILCYCT